MARYIDAERIPNDEYFNGLTDKEKAKVIGWFLQAPTADVVEIVRCKDCNNCEMLEDVYYCNYFNRNVDEDGYCSNWW